MSFDSKYFLLLRLHFNNISYHYFKDTTTTAILVSLAFLCVRLITSIDQSRKNFFQKA